MGTLHGGDTFHSQVQPVFDILKAQTTFICRRGRVFFFPFGSDSAGELRLKNIISIESIGFGRSVSALRGDEAHLCLLLELAPVCMKIECVQFDRFQPLVDDYLHSFSRVAQFFTYNPKEEESFRKRIHYLDHRKNSASRSQLVHVLKAYHKPELMHPAVERNLERLHDPRSVVVIGGQQAGILTGPLYTIYKAITLIQLARREEARLGRPVIPVFWIAGEDHDLDEVDHIFLPHPSGRLVKHRLSLPVDGRISVGMITPPPDILQAWLDELALLLPDSEYKLKMLTEFRELAEGASLSRFFARLMNRLFGEYGLVQIDSSFSPLRQLETPFFQQLIDENESIHQAVSQQMEEGIRQGYPPQVMLTPDDALLFFYLGDERLALIRDGTQFVTRDGAHRWSKEELYHLAGEHPERFSNNVLTRPLMQEYLFPTLAFVGGPGEIAYWALLGQAFSQTGLQMPPIVPRMRFTLVDRSSEKAMGHLGLTFDDVVNRLEEKRTEWIAKLFPFEVEALFDNFRTQLKELYDPMIKQVSEAVPEVSNLGKSHEQKVLGQVDYFERQVTKALTKRYSAELNRFRQLELLLFPQGKPQERVYNVSSFYNLYGEAWIEQVLAKPLYSTDHKMVYL